jgi:hypothetical protein
MAKKEASLKKDDKSVRVGPGNFVSQLFFFWIFGFIWMVRRVKDINQLCLSLRKSETAAYNDKKLEKSWKKEVALAAKENRYALLFRLVD